MPGCRLGRRRYRLRSAAALVALRAAIRRQVALRAATLPGSGPPCRRRDELSPANARPDIYRFILQASADVLFLSAGIDANRVTGHPNSKIQFPSEKLTDL